jgi:prepilin-type N-terminal cleavage/methylation domain-containing protein
VTRRRPRTRARRGQAGFTLIELMISLVISSMLVAMILGIFTTMSAAYRTQQQVAELQQVLSAARATVSKDVLEAGYQMSQGFRWAGDGGVQVPALSITNGSNAPDQIAVFYADPSAQAAMSAVQSPDLTQATVDSPDTFQPGDLAVLTLAETSGNSLGFESGTRPPEEPAVGDPVGLDPVLAKIPYDYACVLEVASVSPTTITFSTSGTWGTSSNSHCADVITHFNDVNVVSKMIYRFVSRAYRIDPTRKDLSVFQMSPSGGLVADDWQDLGLGFTDFQVASRWYDTSTGVDTADLDTDPVRNWYSGDDQANRCLSSTTIDPNNPDKMFAALQVSFSFVVRTQHRVVEGAVTAATPALIDPARPDNGDVGDRTAIQLDGVPDASRPQELRGDNIYRYATTKVDVRNLGVGR